MRPENVLQTIRCTKTYIGRGDEGLRLGSTLAPALAVRLKSHWVPVEAPIRIVIADDHVLFREGLRLVLSTEPNLAVVGDAGDGEEAVERVLVLAPDILLLDLSMPRMPGLDVLPVLARRAPRASAVVLSATVRHAEMMDALAAGARGILQKTVTPMLVHQCIRAVMSGKFWVGHQRYDNASQAREALEPRAAKSQLHLTAREETVMARVAEGLSNLEIARRLQISEQTVKNHLQHIFDKVGVSSRLELAIYAMDRGSAGDLLLTDVQLHHVPSSCRPPLNGTFGPLLGHHVHT